MKRVWITGIQNLSALGLFVLAFHVGLNLLQLCSRALGRFISILMLEKITCYRYYFRALYEEYMRILRNRYIYT